MRPDHSDARNPLYRIVAVDFWHAGQRGEAFSAWEFRVAAEPRGLNQYDRTPFVAFTVKTDGKA